MNSKFLRWLPAIAHTSAFRKTALGVAGVAFVSGAVAGPTVSATADTRPAQPVMVMQAVSDDHGGGHGDHGGKGPDRDRLIPHGTQGDQSMIGLDSDQKANA